MCGSSSPAKLFKFALVVLGAGSVWHCYRPGGACGWPAGAAVKVSAAPGPAPSLKPRHGPRPPQNPPRSIDPETPLATHAGKCAIVPLFLWLALEALAFGYDPSIRRVVTIRDPSQVGAALHRPAARADASISIPGPSRSKSAEVLCPCNLMGSPCDVSDAQPSNGHGGAATELESSVEVRLGSGQFGNHLFLYAAGVVVSGEKKMRLSLPGNKAVSRLPRLTELQPHGASRKDVMPVTVGSGLASEGPGAPYYQHLEWATRFTKHRKRLCYFMGMADVLKTEAARPGPNDAVVYFRNYGKHVWGDVFDVYMGWVRLAPHSAFGAHTPRTCTACKHARVHSIPQSRAPGAESMHGWACRQPDYARRQSRSLSAS